MFYWFAKYVTLNRITWRILETSLNIKVQNLSRQNTISTEWNMCRLFHQFLGMNELIFTLHTSHILTFLLLLKVQHDCSICFYWVLLPAYYSFHTLCVFFLILKKKKIKWFSYVFHMSCCIRLYCSYQRSPMEYTGTYHKNRYISVWNIKWTGPDNTKVVLSLSSRFLPAMTFSWPTLRW